MPHFERYNAAEDLLSRNAGRAHKIAVVDVDGEHSYGEITRAANRFANLLEAIGVHPEQRILLVLDDTVAFSICFLGAIKAGVVPIPLNTLFTADDYAFIIEDSRAAALFASPGHIDRLNDADSIPGYVTGPPEQGFASFDEALAAQDHHAPTFASRADDVAFWLYTSGTTGRPKGAMHAHSDLLATADRYALEVLQLDEQDVVFSAAKLFFAYGLGNSLTFPFAVGATVVLHDGPPAADTIKALIDRHHPTVFFGVPTLYAMLLNTGQIPAAGHHLRLAVSAGEALPEAILKRWQDATGIAILDGIGSTEMLHIYISNRPDDVRPGTSGTPVPGYQVKLTDDDAGVVADGEMGDLHVSGPSLALGYWNRRALNQSTFQGGWMRTGDKYRRDASGAYVYCGRSDDLLKVGGVYVSPMEVENALLEHDAVAEAAVIGAVDEDELVKPKAFVVTTADVTADDTLATALIEHVRTTLASYKRPRWVEFLEVLPKTATGKIQRYKLR